MRVATFLLLVVLLPQGLAQAAGTNPRSHAALEPRVALVIGNNDYRETVGSLRNAVADARAVRIALANRRFEVVYRENTTRRTLHDAIYEFIGKLTNDTVGIFYYSGHGVEINGTNYLVPTDLDARTPADFKRDAIDLSEVLEEMGKNADAFRMVIVDACRTNGFRSRNRGIPGSRGLHATEAVGVFQLFAAGKDEEAADFLDDQDRHAHGVFARVFLEEIEKPGLEVRDIAKQVREKVRQLAAGAGRKQQPQAKAEIGTKNFIFTPVQAASPISPTDEQIDDELWRDLRNTESQSRLQNYLDTQPHGRYRAHVADRLLVLREQTFETRQPVSGSEKQHILLETDGIANPDILLDRLEAKLDQQLGVSWRDARFFRVRFSRDLPFQLAGPLKKVQYRIVIDEVNANGSFVKTSWRGSGYASSHQSNNVSDDQLKTEAMLDAITSAFNTRERN